MSENRFYTAIFSNGECVAKRLIEQDEPLNLDESMGEVLIDEEIYYADGTLVLVDGVVLVCPSPAHEYKSGKWVLNKTRAAALATAQAQTDAASKIQAMTDAIQSYLDTTAQDFGFDDIKSAALRASFTGSPLQPLGLKLGVWMDEVWAVCKKLLTQWQAGDIAEPTMAVVLAALPPAPTNE